MREQHPAGQAPAAGIGEFIDGYTAPSPEVVALIGEDIVSYMDRANGALSELGSMAATEDPFIHDDRGCQIDLGFLKSEQVTLVHEYRAVTRPFKGVPAGSVAKFGRKIIRKMPGIHEDVRQRVVGAEPGLDEAGERLAGTVRETHEKTNVSFLPSLRMRMDELTAARDMLPSKTTMVVVDNMYSAGISARNHVQSMARQRRAIRIGTPQTVIDFTEMLKDGQVDFKEVIRTADAIRKLGTANFSLLHEVIEVERIKESLGVLGAADTARERLPDAASLDDGELETLRAAEQYLAGQTDMATAIIRDSEPEMLKDSGLRAIIERLHLPSPVPETPEQAERKAAIAKEVLCKLTEAKNVLRGGRRLKPGDGQTESEVKHTADKLYALKDAREDRLLEAEECGVLVAMVVGRFDSFVNVVAAVGKYVEEDGLGAFPRERSEVVRELSGFDLKQTLSKLDELMGDTHARLNLERVLGLQNTKVVRDYLSRELKEADAAA